MQVRMRCPIAWSGQTAEAGEIVDLPDAMANVVIARGDAERVDRPVETRVDAPPQNRLTPPASTRTDKESPAGDPGADTSDTGEGDDAPVPDWQPIKLEEPGEPADEP